MRQGQQNRRGRNRGGNGGGRKPQNSMSRNYESSGPDVKIRGTAMHIAEKYSSLARDAMSSGDVVAAENYLQHAEHYNRIILAAQAQNPVIPGFDGQSGINGGGRFNQPDQFQRDYDGDSEDGDSDDYVPQQRGFHERSGHERPHNDRPHHERSNHERPNHDRSNHERPVYNQHQQPQPYVPQNAFPQTQPLPQPIVPAAPNGSVPPAGDLLNSPVEDRAPRRRRRRPIGEAPPAKPLNGRNGSDHGAPGMNGAGGNGSTPAPDESSS
jgi:hypothetical protein